jgi:hypothetical protein
MRLCALLRRDQPSFLVILVIIYSMVKALVLTPRSLDPSAVLHFTHWMNLFSVSRNCTQSVAFVAIAAERACHRGRKDKGGCCQAATCPCESPAPSYYSTRVCCMAFVAILQGSKEILLAVVHTDLEDSRRRQSNIAESVLASKPGISDVDFFLDICESNLTIEPHVYACQMLETRTTTVRQNSTTVNLLKQC